MRRWWSEASGTARLVAVGAAIAWALWIGTALSAWIPLVPLSVHQFASLPVALLLHATAILLGHRSRRGSLPIQRSEREVARLRRQASGAGGVSVALLVFVAAGYLVPMPALISPLILPALVGAVLFAALGRSASREARDAGDRMRPVDVLTGATAVIGITISILLLGGLLFLFWAFRDFTF